MAAWSEIDAPSLLQISRKLLRACTIAKPHKVSGMMIDTDKLSAQEQIRFAKGFAPGWWVEWWKDAARLLASRRDTAMITLQPGMFGKRLIQSIDVAALAELQESVVWSIPAGVVLSWGGRRGC